MNTLRQAVRDYLQLRRNLGFKLEQPGRDLPNFVRFLERRGAQFITHKLALLWARQPVNVQPAYWAQRLTYVRGFARYRSATDPRTQIPPPGLLPFRPKRAKPYLYSDHEIRRLMSAARDLPYRYEHEALRPWVYYYFLGLLAVSGIRVGEASNLEIKDVDLHRAVLTIRGAKFGKTRLVSLHPTTCAALAEYITKREQHWAGKRVSPYLFVTNLGNRLGSAGVHQTFCKISRQIGLRGPDDSHGPRLHDLRHRFATNTLVRWYRSGEDPERRLPTLSAFLGHFEVADTYWYLSGSPELMREAMRRLEHRWEGVS